MDNILKTVKKLLGISEDYDHFDPDIIVSINTALMSLTQLGIGPTAGFLVTSNDEKWADFLGDRIDLESAKMYVYLKARLLFDPPSNSFIVEAMERQINELTWRLNVQVENTSTSTSTTTTTTGEVVV